MYVCTYVYTQRLSSRPKLQATALRTPHSHLQKQIARQLPQQLQRQVRPRLRRLSRGFPLSGADCSFARRFLCILLLLSDACTRYDSSSTTPALPTTTTPAPTTANTTPTSTKPESTTSSTPAPSTAAATSSSTSSVPTTRFASAWPGVRTLTLILFVFLTLDFQHDTEQDGCYHPHLLFHPHNLEHDTRADCSMHRICSCKRPRSCFCPVFFATQTDTAACRIHVLSECTLCGGAVD